MGKIIQTRQATTNSFWIFGGSFSAHPSSDVLAKHKIKKTAIKRNIWVHFINSKVRVWVEVKEEEKYNVM